MDMLRTDFADELHKGETSEQLLSMFVWYLFQNLSNPFTLKKQVIKYGAPGTGKTYTAKRHTVALRHMAGEISQRRPELTTSSASRWCNSTPPMATRILSKDCGQLDQGRQSQLTLQNGVLRILPPRRSWENEVHGIPETRPRLEPTGMGIP